MALVDLCLEWSFLLTLTTNSEEMLYVLYTGVVNSNCRNRYNNKCLYKKKWSSIMFA